MQEELGLPDREDPAKWSVSELNAILRRHVAHDRNGCALHTFVCIEWESELCRGVMRACSYLFNMPTHRFHSMGIQVYCTRFIP